jgi:hypothetical protein
MKLKAFAFAAPALLFAAQLLAQTALDKLPPEVRIKHTAGDSVQPAYEGWTGQPDGTVTMWFGYYNRNTEERVNIPVGVNNRFDTGGQTGLNADQGQPAYFYPGFHQFVFKVDLPKDWTKDQKLVWSVTTNGITFTANGWIVPGYEVDEGVIAMNLSPGGNAPGNRPPEITVSGDQTVEVGGGVQLTASATDDGLPEPRGQRGGVRVRWILYRGPGDAEFEPRESAAVYGKPVRMTTNASFSVAGVYWLRAIAFDGQLESYQDLKITVIPGSH